MVEGDYDDVERDRGVNDTEGCGAASKAVDTTEAEMLRPGVVVGADSIMLKPLKPLLR
jgi:hypothetical protein